MARRACRCRGSPSSSCCSWPAVASSSCACARASPLPIPIATGRSAGSTNSSSSRPTPRRDSGSPRWRATRSRAGTSAGPCRGARCPSASSPGARATSLHRENTMRDPQALMSTADLASLLGQPRLRVYDCTTYLETPPPGSDDPYIAVPGRRTFEEAHIPGADFLDLQGEFSDPTTRLRFMMPPTAQLEAAFGRHGLAGDSRVVLYSIGTMMWATRFWWMLRSLGFDAAAVLDGGFDKWKAEGRPTESGPARGYPSATFKASPLPGFFVDKRAVLAATKEPGTVIVNALGPQFHQGLEPSRYGRPGRVPGSVNVPAATLVNASADRKSVV